MTISHSLSMATAWPAPHVARELTDFAQSVGLFDASVAAEQVLDEGAVTAPGMWIRVVETKAQPWSPLVTDLQVTPTVRVVFEPNKTVDLSSQEDDIIRLVSGLLDRVPGDAVLQYQYEIIWLLRRAGELSLNEREDLWPPQRLAAVSQPYRRATYSFAEE